MELTERGERDGDRPSCSTGRRGRGRKGGRVVLARAGRRRRPARRGSGEWAVGCRRCVAACVLRAEQVHGGGGRAALACVRTAVPRPDADRPARGRDRQPVSAEGARHRARAAVPHAVQRGARPAPGGEGRRGRGGAAEDDDRQGPRPPRRGARRASRRAARAGRHRLDRGRRRGPGRRAPALGGDARDRGVGADRREHARLEGGRVDRVDRHAARRPDGHGLHEHERHPRRGQVRRDVDRDGDRGRPHLAHAAELGGRGHAAHDPAQEADEPDPVHLGCGGGRVDRAQPVARRELRHRLHRGNRLRDLRHPDRAARRRHDDPLVRHADAREGERDHEAAALDGDARLDLGDQLRQDRHADAQPDDGGRADDPWSPLHDLRRRLRDRGDDQARLRAA